MATTERGIRVWVSTATLAALLFALLVIGLVCLTGSTSAARYAVSNSPTDCPVSFAVITSVDPSTDTNQLNDVKAVSSNDVWAVGLFTTGGSNNVQNTLAEHWNGTAWSVVPSPNVGTVTSALAGVAVVSSNDVWAVGYSNNSGIKTLTEHWDGSTWSVVPSPSEGANNYLNGVSAASANDVWAVGYYYDNVFPPVFHPTIEHWDGTAWSLVSHPDGNSLSGVAAISSNDVWAVGRGSNSDLLIEHWDGTAWSLASHPDPSGSVGFADVSGASSSDVWAVGSYINSSNVQLTLVEHWDGTAWSVVSSPNQGSGVNSLTGVSAVSGSDVWAVGDYNNSSRDDKTLVEHWDGTAWSIVPSPNEGSTYNGLNSVTTAGDTDVWAVGLYDTGQATHTQVIHGSPSCSSPTATVTAVGSATATTIPGDFADVPPSSPFYSYVHTLTSHGAVGGYPCGGPGEPCDANQDPYYRPGANVTRGQLSKIIALAAGLNSVIPPDQQTFHDVAPNDTFHLYIEQLAQTGAIAGYPCSSPALPCDSANRPWFLPGNNATRGQISKIVSIAAGFSESIPANQQSFTDVPHSSAFWLYIERLYTRGIIGGYNDAAHCTAGGAPCFLPGANTTRGQIAKIGAIAFYPDRQKRTTGK